ncbi:MAG: hypothetical protein OXC40_06435 [Proteobacteria bacterium]|nr:hypothetical protein [Pseudomonadota bacterium]
MNFALIQLVFIVIFFFASCGPPKLVIVPAQSEQEQSRQPDDRPTPLRQGLPVPEVTNQERQPVVLQNQRSNNGQILPISLPSTPPPSPCNDPQNFLIEIGGDTFILDSWSSTIWAIKYGSGGYGNFVMSFDDLIYFMRGNSFNPVVIAGELYRPLDHNITGEVAYMKFDSASQSQGSRQKFYHAFGRAQFAPAGYTVTYEIQEQSKSRSYDIEIDLAPAGSCVAMYRNQAGLPYSGGEPILLLHPYDQTSYYKKSSPQ